MTKKQCGAQRVYLVYTPPSQTCTKGSQGGSWSGDHRGTLLPGLFPSPTHSQPLRLWALLHLPQGNRNTPCLAPVVPPPTPDLRSLDVTNPDQIQTWQQVLIHSNHWRSQKNLKAQNWSKRPWTLFSSLFIMLLRKKNATQGSGVAPTFSHQSLTKKLSPQKWLLTHISNSSIMLPSQTTVLNSQKT